MTILLIFTACGDNVHPKPGPDATGTDDFGMPCTPDRFEPLATCRTDTEVVGWCIVTGADATGICRRNCMMGTCPSGERPLPIFDDCYCLPR
ncbi:MAG: hypothetical protein JWO36_6192 [Myxococcales bacterium]|nr:hypothetical protein [Myxococcales bacterium]